MTRDAASGSPLICLPSSHIVLHVAAITAGLGLAALLGLNQMSEFLYFNF